jgi:hypothetical protein
MQAVFVDFQESAVGFLRVDSVADNHGVEFDEPRLSGCMTMEKFMRSIINVIKAAFRASLSGPGLLGWLVALVKPIVKALNMAGDIDLLANYFGAAGRFLETGWGTLTSVALGAVIIGYAVNRNMRRAVKDESHQISILELLSEAAAKGWVFNRDTLQTFMLALRQSASEGNIVIWGVLNGDPASAALAPG